MDKFAKRLREVLELKQISQSEFAKRINMSQGAINSYCTGRREPSLDVLVVICKTLDESSDYLLGLDK